MMEDPIPEDEINLLGACQVLVKRKRLLALIDRKEGGRDRITQEGFHLRASTRLKLACCGSAHRGNDAANVNAAGAAAELMAINLNFFFT